MPRVPAIVGTGDAGRDPIRHDELEDRSCLCSPREHPVSGLTTDPAAGLPSLGFFAFGLSEFTDLLDKGPRFAKVAEPEVRSMQ